MTAPVPPTPENRTGSHEPAVVTVDYLHDTFEIDDILDLDRFQIEQGLLKFIRKPFTDEFVARYSDVLGLLSENQADYPELLEDEMYRDAILLDLAQMRQRHERRRAEDGHHITPDEVDVAFWTRRNVLAYIASLVIDVKAAYDEYPEGNSSQQAS